MYVNEGLKGTYDVHKYVLWCGYIVLMCMWLHTLLVCFMCILAMVCWPHEPQFSVF